MSCETQSNRISNAARSGGGITGPSNKLAGITGSTMYRLGRGAGTVAFLPVNASLGAMKLGIRASVSTAISLGKFGAGVVSASPGARAVNAAIQVGATGVRTAQVIAANPTVRSAAGRTASTGKVVASAGARGAKTAAQKGASVGRTVAGAAAQGIKKANIPFSKQPLGPSMDTSSMKAKVAASKKSGK